MPSGRTVAYGEPNEFELRLRVRKWVQYYWSLREPKGVLRKEYAAELGFSPPTISNVLNEEEVPGFDMFAALHFRLGLNPRDLLREDPPPYVLSQRPRRRRAPRMARRGRGQTKVRTDK